MTEPDLSTPIAKLLDLRGKTAIVTGGAMGIGLGIARRLAEAGASVVVADMDEAAGSAAVAEIATSGWKAAFIKTNVSDEAQVAAMVDFAVRTFGGVDILANNAGIYPMAPAMQMPVADFDRIIAVNLRSVFLCTQAAARVMIVQGRGGKIVNTTSIDALHPSAVGLAAYDASKHGVWGFTKNVALELAPHGIQVNAVAPGAIATPGAGAGKPTTKEQEAATAQFIKRVPMARQGVPDDIARVVLFLASDLSSYMTGSQVVADGGMLLT